MKIRTFISGEYTFPVYHHYRNLKARVPQILGDAFQVVRQTEHYETLEYWDYQGVDVVVLSTDEWVPKSGTQVQQAQAILHYVAMGGGLVFMHNLDLGGDVEMAQMLGGRLRTQLWGRPQDDEPVVMRYEPMEHPISRGIQPFEALDNRHQIHFDNLTPRQVFLNARLSDGLTVPAGWAVEFGLGRAVFLGPGHSDSAMDNPQYARLLRNSARWAAGREVDNS